jgi:hypothetical protein
MGDKKATDDDKAVDVLKFRGEDGLILMAQLFNSVYETGAWPKNFVEIKMSALKNNPKDTKYSDHRKSALSHMQQR